MKGYGLLLVICSCMWGYAMAQCPAGIPSAGNPACIPPDRSNSPYYQPGSGAQSGPTGDWQRRWGAFALDHEVGLGSARNMKSKRSAEKAAMTVCQSKGGRNCKIALTYSNQCGVIIEGDRGHNVAAAESVERAIELGSAICERADSNCQVYYSDCSQAEFVE